MSDPTSRDRELLPGKPLLSIGLSVLAGVLLPLSLAPFDFWWSGFISILLLLAVLQGASIQQALLRWYFFGIGQYLLGASWVYVSIHTHGGASIFVAGLLTAAFVAAISIVVMLQGYLYQRFFVAKSDWVWLIAFPSLWLLKEWVTMWLFTGFPWALLGYGQLHSPLAGYAPVIGVLGIGFVVALVACLFFAGVVWLGERRWRWWGGAAGLVLLGASLTQINFTKPVGEPLSISLVQGDIAQETKWQRSMVGPIIKRYADLSHTEWGRDLIIWPEAAITLFARDAQGLLERWDQEGKASGTALLLGIPSRDEASYFNSAVVVGDGAGLYQKRHLVPFGEYVPLENMLRGVIQFFDLPMSRNRAGPADQSLLRMQEMNLALSICYEIVFPDLVRRDAINSPLLVTISNDTWFGESLGPHQHMQMAQMRALENGRYLVRATNNGVTAIVSEKGRIINQLPQFESGVLRGNVLPMGGTTPYSRMGDSPLLLGLALLLGALLCLPRLKGRSGPDSSAVPQ